MRRNLIDALKFFAKATAVIFEGLLNFGADMYLFLMMFSLATIGLAKIILKTCSKQNFKYSNLIIFCSIGLIISGIFKIFNINLSGKYLETLICIVMNIIIFIVFKYIKKQLK